MSCTTQPRCPASPLELFHVHDELLPHTLKTNSAISFACAWHLTPYTCHGLEVDLTHIMSSCGTCCSSSSPMVP
jgi:hypothetical protein